MEEGKTTETQKALGSEENRRAEGPQQSRRIVEKYYIEVNASSKQKFINGFLGGLGWGIGITVGTAIFIGILGIIVSKVDFVPIFGQFLAEVIKSAQTHLNAR